MEDKYIVGHILPYGPDLDLLYVMQGGLVPLPYCRSFQMTHEFLEDFYYNVKEQNMYNLYE